MSCTNATDIILQLSGIGVPVPRNDVVNNALDASITLLSPLKDMADDHRLIRKLVSEVSSSESVVVRAVAAEVARYASLFLEKLADVHHKILKRDVEIVVEGKISLIKMCTVLKSSALILRHLKNIVLELKTTDERQLLSVPAALINNLHLDALTGYEDLKMLSGDLQSAVDRIYLQQIKKWCLYGQIHSKCPGDFFVHIDANGNFCYRETDCPAMISVETSRRIFELGAMLSRLYSKMPSGKIHSTSSKDLSMHESTFNNLPVPLEPTMLDAAVEQVETTLSRNILSTILPRLRVRSFVLFLKDFFLLGNGEFALRLIQMTQLDFRSMRQRHLGTLKDDTVHAVLAKTLSSLNYEDKDNADGENDDEHDHAASDRRSLRMILREDNELGQTDFSHFLYGVAVQLKVKLVWPLDILVAKDDLVQYSRVFDYLVSLRRAQERLHSLWRGRRTTGAHASITTAAWSAAFRTQAFLGTLNEYYHADVISEYSKELEAAIAGRYEMHDPSRLARQHRDAFKRMKSAVLLADHDFLVIMNQLFTTVDQVVEALDRESEHSDRCKAMLHLVERAINGLTMEEGVDTLLLKLHINSGLQW